MPYIDKDLRDRMEIEGRKPLKPGELNYAVTCLVDSYLVMRGVSYTSLNEAIGVLECAKLELYRRLAAPYEDKKMSENGDAYVAASL